MNNNFFTSLKTILALLLWSSCLNTYQRQEQTHSNPKVPIVVNFPTTDSNPKKTFSITTYCIADQQLIFMYDQKGLSVFYKTDEGGLEMAKAWPILKGVISQKKKPFSQLTHEEACLLATEGKWEIKRETGELIFLGLRARGGMGKQGKNQSPPLPTMDDMKAAYLGLIQPDRQPTEGEQLHRLQKFLTTFVDKKQRIVACDEKKFNFYKTKIVQMYFSLLFKVKRDKDCDFYVFQDDIEEKNILPKDVAYLLDLASKDEKWWRGDENLIKMYVSFLDVLLDLLSKLEEAVEPENDKITQYIKSISNHDFVKDSLVLPLFANPSSDYKSFLKLLRKLIQHNFYEDKICLYLCGALKKYSNNFTANEKAELLTSAIKAKSVIALKNITKTFKLDPTKLMVKIEIDNSKHTGAVSMVVMQDLQQEVDEKDIISLPLKVDSPDIIHRTVPPLIYCVASEATKTSTAGEVLEKIAWLLAQCYQKSVPSLNYANALNEILDSSAAENILGLACMICGQMPQLCDKYKDIITGLITLGADINFPILLPAPSNGPRSFITPFTYALSGYNISFAEWLINNHNADPTRARMLNRENHYPNTGFYASKERGKIVYLSNGMRQIFLLEEKYLLEKILAQQIQEPKTTKIGQETITQHSKEKTKEKAEKVAIKDVKDNYDNFIEAYISLKEEQTKTLEKSQSTPSEQDQIAKQAFQIAANQFELLLFKIVSAKNYTAREAIAKQINALLLAHPALECHILKTVLDENIQLNTSKEKIVQEDILSSLPQLLHKYCVLQKKNVEMQQRHLLDLNRNLSFSLDKIENSYKIDAAMSHEAYIYITPALQEVLDAAVNKQFQAKIVALLKKPIQFIKADSQGLSGIKSYQGIHKVKLASENSGIIIRKIYRDKFGNLFLMATDIVTHKDLENNMQDQIAEILSCDSFQEILDKVYSS